jgi:hypothetical protein
MLNYPNNSDLQSQMFYIWQSYLDWSLDAPLKRKVMAQLSTSEQITEQSKHIGMQTFVILLKLFKNILMTAN